MHRRSVQSPERRILDFAAMGFRDVLMLGRYAYSRAHPPLKPHTHGKVCEICILERGRQSYVVGTERVELAGGDVLVVQPNEVHGTGGAPEEPGVLYWIEFQYPEGRTPFLMLPRGDAAALFAAFRALPQRVFGGGAVLQPLLDRVFAACDAADDPLRAVNLRNLLLRLLLDIVALSRRAAQRRMASPVRRALGLVEQRLPDPLRVESLALEVGLSPSHFKVRFKEDIGIPPAEYVARRRVEKAKERLRLPGAEVTRLALDLGFCSSQHFATVFKRYTGITPRQYRRGVAPVIEAAAPVAGSGAAFHPVE